MADDITPVLSSSSCVGAISDEILETETTHLDVVDRYYTKYYKRDIKGRLGEDLCVMVHSNRICLITLAPSHPILYEKKTVVGVNFQVTEKTNRLDNEVMGKFKRGAQQLTELSPLCHVSCDDGSTYTLVSCLTSSLVEVNGNLVTTPSLLTSKPQSSGYVAILLPRLKDFEKTMGKLESQEQYDSAILLRQPKRTESIP